MRFVSRSICVSPITTRFCRSFLLVSPLQRPSHSPQLGLLFRPLLPRHRRPFVTKGPSVSAKPSAFVKTSASVKTPMSSRSKPVRTAVIGGNIAEANVEPISTAPSTIAASFSVPASSAPVLRQDVRLACVQMSTGPVKQDNLARAHRLVADAVRQHADTKIVVLPECFNSPYGTQFFAAYAETFTNADSVTGIPSIDEAPSYHALSRMARENRIYLVGGSVPERDRESGALYNTSLIFNPHGQLLAQHRKVHLFDIDIPGGFTFRESETLSAGNALTIVDLPEYGRLSVAICYDIRFPELATIAARHGCFALVLPAAFNTTTGPLHWRLLAQARALDNQLYVAFASPARSPDPEAYQAWGHSLIVDPMAAVLEEAETDETIVSAALDAGLIERTRRNIPLNTQRRFDVYPDVAR